MKILVHTDNNLKGSQSFSAKISQELENSLERFKDNITTLEVHLSNENPHKNNLSTVRCTIEARLAGRQPLTTTDHASILEQAIDGCTEKLIHLIEHTLGRIEGKKKHFKPHDDSLNSEDET